MAVAPVHSSDAVAEQAANAVSTAAAVQPAPAADAATPGAENGNGAGGDAAPMKLGKRKVAMHVAYVGTPFRGLQAQSTDKVALGTGDTVEDALAKALAATGGIQPSNASELRKVNWSRSSRTDKGVHALACVVAFKMECDPNSFLTDAEGLHIAQGINEHLPETVRVLAVQRVNKGFNARERCGTRTYHYFLPAAMLDMKCDGGAEDEAILDRLRGALTLFEGTHPFHNYTKRRLYRAEARENAERKAKEKRSRFRHENIAATAAADAAAATGTAAADAATAADVADQGTAALNGGTAASATKPGGSQPSADVAEQSAAQSAAQAAALSRQQQPQARVAPDSSNTGAKPQQSRRGRQGKQADPAPMDEDDDDAGAADMEEEEEALEQNSGPRYHTIEWNYEVKPGDKVERAHHRHVRACRLEGGPVALAPGGPPALKIVIMGDSFMLHQIRHMIGTAVAVATNRISLAFADATLCIPGRAALPLAPGSPLVLADNAFMPFPREAPGGPTSVGALTGDRLTLREGGRQARDAFEREVLHPHISTLLEGPDWDYWRGKLDGLSYREDAMQEMLTAAAVWRSHRKPVRKPGEPRGDVAVAAADGGGAAAAGAAAADGGAAEAGGGAAADDGGGAAVSGGTARRSDAASAAASGVARDVTAAGAAGS